MIPSGPGTYALVLVHGQTERLRIGRFGVLGTRPGTYVYVGSAFGSGGLAARIHHHKRRGKRLHWHVDYLREACRLLGAWYCADRTPREHVWAAAFAGLPGAVIPLPRFGASDCRCPAHLVWFPRLPDDRMILEVLAAARTHRSRVKTGAVSWEPLSDPEPLSHPPAR